MNRNGQSSSSACSLLLLIGTLLLLFLVGAVVGDDLRNQQEKQQPILDASKHVVDSDVADLRSFFGDIFGAGRTSRKAGRSGDGAVGGRTFGLRRIQFMMMPLVYKMGVMMTMLAVLTVISLKGLAVGVILLILKLSAIFGKLYTGSHYNNYGHSPAAGWNLPQPVHVHLHSNGGGGGPPVHSHPAYNGWESGPSAPDEGYYYKG